MVENLEKSIQPMRPTGESRQLRLKTLSKSSATLRFATHGICCFWTSLPTATISLNKQDLLMPSGGLIFHPSCERVRILYDPKHTARVVLGPAHPRRNINLTSSCYDFVLRIKEKVLHFRFITSWGTSATPGMNVQTLRPRLAPVVSFLSVTL